MPRVQRRLARQVVIARLWRLATALEEEAVRLGRSTMPTARRHSVALETVERAEAVREALRVLDKVPEDRW